MTDGLRRLESKVVRGEAGMMPLEQRRMLLEKDPVELARRREAKLAAIAARTKTGGER